MDTQDTTNVSESAQSFNKAHIIIVGNEKGGCGKTTTTMHLIVALLRLGFSVGCIDLDSRQRSLTRYVENRRQTIAKEGMSLPMPRHAVVNKSPFDSHEEAKKDERERFAQALSTMYGTNDFVVIDTPGNDTYMSRLAHSFADTIITPINDSFVDLDVLASVDGRTLEIVKPSIYSEIVWEQKLQRAKRDGGSIDWIVMRNRLSNIDAKNKRFMAKVTLELSRRIGFRAAPGFSERVIFRELFLQGLTVLDVMEATSNVKISMSHIAARQEVRDLLKTLNISSIAERIEKLRKEEEAKGVIEPIAKDTAANTSHMEADEAEDFRPQETVIAVSEDKQSLSDSGNISGDAALASLPPAAPEKSFNMTLAEENNQTITASSEETTQQPASPSLMRADSSSVPLPDSFSFVARRQASADASTDALKEAASGFRAPALVNAN
jgi:chromosome partitioning protein